MKPNPESGSLYIVSTPIGHLGDCTHRAVEILGRVHLIAAEDTRRTRILLEHYGLRTPMSSYNAHNQFQKGPRFLDLLKSGKDLALVSDAGTPGVSDPLVHLVRSAVAEGIRVIPAPGPSAAVAALTVSGLPMDRFVFEGFLPKKKGRRTRLETLAAEPRTMVFYESPYRVARTLNDLYEAFGDRQAVLARELTKLHEEVLRGPLKALAEQAEGRTWKGEITLVVAGRPAKKKGN